MSLDYKAVADAVAARFSAANVTAPSGETNVRVSTAALPDGITQEPTVLVLPPQVEFDYGPSLKKRIAVFPVNFYLFRIRDNQRNSTLLLNWMTALEGQLPETLAHLGLPDYVTGAELRDMEGGIITFHDVRFEGIRLSVAVHMWTGMNAVA